jgi:hypothetical protein
MKRTACTALATLALVLMALVPVHAQNTTAAANIPFNFTVDGVIMPAGQYLITSPSERVITIQRVGGPEVKATLTNQGSATQQASPAKLVFHKYNSACFLAAVWMPNSDHAREFFASASEIQVARKGSQDVVELALLKK